MNRSDIHLKNTIDCLVVERGRAAWGGTGEPQARGHEQRRGEEQAGLGDPICGTKKNIVCMCTYLVK